MKRIVVVLATGLLVLVAAWTLAVPTRALAHDPPASGVSADADAQQDIVILLPFERRVGESVRNGGHQPWRSDPRMAAMAELQHFIREMSVDVTDEAQNGCRIVKNGTDDYGRATVVIEKDIPSSVWQFKLPVARVHMFKNAGDVWITTKIVIQQRRNKK